MAYSFHKLPHFLFSKLWAKSLQSGSQLLICDCTTFVRVHVCKHCLQTLNLFWRKIFSNDLKYLSKSAQFIQNGIELYYISGTIKLNKIKKLSHDENIRRIFLCLNLLLSTETDIRPICISLFELIYWNEHLWYYFGELVIIACDMSISNLQLISISSLENLWKQLVTCP